MRQEIHIQFNLEYSLKNDLLKDFLKSVIGKTEQNKKIPIYLLSQLEILKSPKDVLQT